MVSEFARRRIRAATRHALEQAGVRGIVPTPLAAVSRAAGISETIDLSQVPPDMVARRPRAWQRVLGAVLFRPRILVVDRSQGNARGRFIEAHEISHKLIPTHETIVRLDDEGRIFGDLKREIEKEAELGAAELLFQGDLFTRHALDLPVSLAAPLGLAAEFDASLTAAVRHYPDYHPDVVAIVVAGRYPNVRGALPVWSSHESPSFRNELGAAADLFPNGVPSRDELEPPIGTLIRQALEFDDIAKSVWVVRDLRGEPRDMAVEAFFNQRLVLILLAERRAARRLTRRVDLRIAQTDSLSASRPNAMRLGRSTPQDWAPTDQVKRQAHRQG